MENLANALVVLSNFVIIPALAYGSQLALGALGVTIIVAVLRFSNFAHGELMSFGAMSAVFAVWVLQWLGISIAPLSTALLALPVAIVMTVAIALLTDRFVYRFYRVRKADTVVLLIVSIGVMLAMAGIIRFAIGPDDRVFDDGVRFIISVADFKALTGLKEGLAIRTSQAITIVMAVLCVGFVFWLLKYTRIGKMMRAYSDNEDLALLSGVNPDQIVRWAWVLAATLAAIAGTLYGLDKSFKPIVFQQLLLPIFAAAIVGGLGSPVGAVAGGMIVAFSEIALTYSYKKVATYLLPEALKPDGMLQLLSTNYKYAVSFIILVAVLLVRPNGLFNGRPS